MVRSRSGLSTLLNKDHLDKNVPVMLLELAPKIQASQIYQHYYIAYFNFKSGRTQYENGQKSREDRKGKKGRENKKSEKSRRGSWENKVDLVVKKNSYFKASDYYYIICQC